MRRNDEEGFRRTYLAWRKEVARLKLALQISEKITALIDSDVLWSKFLLPMLDGQMRQFETTDSYHAPIRPTDTQESLEVRRGRAKQAYDIREAFASRHGKRDTILADLEIVQANINQARQSGLVKPEWDDEPI